MSAMRTFFEEYVDEITESVLNNHPDNYDHMRYGDLPTSRRDLSWRGLLRDLLRRKGYVSANSLRDSSLAPFQLIAPYVDRFQWLYDHLEDDESRKLLVRVMAYRALGHTKVKLPLSTPDYWQAISQVGCLVNKTDYLAVPFLNWRLFRTDLATLGYPIDIYFTVKGIYTQFVLQQYRCLTDHGSIEVEPGDYVIDGGGCWGDTALYFAHKTGSGGRVFSFEFIPGNLEILHKNLTLNPHLKGRIELVENALWHTSGIPVYYQDDGPGSRVSLETLTGEYGRTDTLTIDDLIQRKSVSSVDFIKLDIEGAELPALKGAMNTILQFRPKLAISIYHRLLDFVEIPELIAQFDLGYRFYIRHLTIHSEETVLFAEAQANMHTDGRASR